jgi:hypothetical protein
MEDATAADANLLDSLHLVDCTNQASLPEELYRKLLRRLTPLLSLGWAVSLMDRSNIGYAEERHPPHTTPIHYSPIHTPLNLGLARKVSSG